MRILIFGDSITQGFFDSQGGWAQRLANHYHTKSLYELLTIEGVDTTEVFNLGISGDTAQDVLDRMEREVAARVWKDDPLVIILAVGINDAQQHNNRADVDVYEFEQMYEALIDQAQQAGRVLCLGLTAVDEAKCDPWPYSSSQAQFSNARINLFEDTIKQVAMRNDVIFVPIHDEFLSELEADTPLLADGLHPNDEGHQFIVDLVRPILDEWY